MSFLSSRTSSGERTNDSAMKSAPRSSANARSPRSFLVSEGMGTRDAGQVHALVALDGPADDDGAHGTPVVHALHAQTNVAVVDEDVVARLEHSAHDLGSDRQVHLIPVGAGDHLVALREHHGSRQIADAELRPLEVGDDGEGTPSLPLDGANRSGHLRMLGVCAVGEVQPGDVHAGGDELLDAPGRGRPERGDDLRAARGLAGHGASVSVNGGNHVSPMDPLLRQISLADTAWAALGRSPAPPA